jgi:UDP-glucose 4-epimerase
VFNVGGDEEVTMNALARRVVELTGSKSGIEHVPYERAYGQQFDDLRRRVPKLDKVRRVIGFKPTKSLDQIIQSVIDEQRRSD